MLRHLFLLVMVFAGCTMYSYGKIWRVNNNPGVAANFTSLQAAHDSASSGDTIHLEGSPTSYGGLSCSKKLVVIGTGFFLDQDTASQALTQSSKVDGITIYEGSEGAVFTGLDFRANSMNIYCNDIVIKRNLFSSPNGSDADYYTGSVNMQYQNNHYPTGASNISITQNYGLRIESNYSSTGILVTNNFISYYAYAGDATTGECVRLNAGTVALFQNNIFRRGTVTAYNSSFTNNIMYAGFMGAGTGNLTSNNIGNSTQFGNANGNQQNVDMTTVFLGPTGNTSDSQWKLKTGSPAIGAGYGSTPANPIDDGIYGGATPYVLAGLPAVPAIYFFQNQPIGSSTDPIDVTIKVKSVTSN